MFQTFQIIADRMKIIEESTNPVEPREILHAVGPPSPVKAEESRKSKADEAFDLMQSPSKKNRIA